MTLSLVVRDDRAFAIFIDFFLELGEVVHGLELPVALCWGRSGFNLQQLSQNCSALTSRKNGSLVCS